MTAVSLKGEPLKLIGAIPKVGNPAPNFTLTKSDLSEIHLSNYRGQKIILNIFPSLDTATCAAAMKHFNKIAAQHSEILVLCVSADLPFAQKRFCGIEHLENIQPASIFRHQDFGTDYGLTIINGPLKGLLARAVIIIDEKGIVTYTQLVSDIAEEPDYDDLLKELT